MNPAPAPAISVTGLRKSFGPTVVLDGLDLSVPEGTVFALLGPNGAGKTTTVDILSTLTPADGGEVRIAGHDLQSEPDAVRASIALTGQFSAVDDLLTGTENRRLDLAMGLMGDPRVVFLDEPTTGLDPRSRRAMWDVVRGLVADGVTILLTTQYLDEADQLADRIGVLDAGRLVAEGTAGELKRMVPGGHVRLEFAGPQPLERAAHVLRVPPADEGVLALEVPGDGSVAALKSLLARLDDAGVEVAGLTVHTPDLDDVFLALTGRPTPAEVTA